MLSHGQESHSLEIKKQLDKGSLGPWLSFVGCLIRRLLQENKTTPSCALVLTWSWCAVSAPHSSLGNQRRRQAWWVRSRKTFMTLVETLKSPVKLTGKFSESVLRSDRQPLIRRLPVSFPVSSITFPCGRGGAEGLGGRNAAPPGATEGSSP